MTVSAVVGPVAGGDGLAAVQSRINEIQSRFGGGSGPAFGAVLANQAGGLRTAASFSGDGVLAASAVAPGARVPAGRSPAVDVAQQYLGVPYVWGGGSPSGFDCSGLVQYVYGRLGVDLPRTAAEQARVGQPVAGLADARPGDLLAFHDPVDHIGIYAGNGLMVVAPKTGDVVKVQAVYETPTAIRRILPSGGPAGVASLSVGSLPVGSLPVESLPVGSLPAGSLPVGSAALAGDFAAQRVSLLAAFTGAAS